jgi:hypothetical protein
LPAPVLQTKDNTKQQTKTEKAKCNTKLQVCRQKPTGGQSNGRANPFQSSHHNSGLPL